MGSENKICQNCKAEFTIEPDDFGFYEKMGVSAPTFCSECRLERRLSWRNERSLYKAQCPWCKKSILSGYVKESPFPVVCHDCWFSDRWDPMEYGAAYDFSKPFFTQFKEVILNRIPRFSLFQINAVNSPYANTVRDVKNTYLAFSVTDSEDIFYSKNVDKSRQLFDCLNATASEQSVGDVYMDKGYNVHFSFMTRACIDSMFLFDCRNARNCFMSSNLRNKEFVFRNKQLTKEVYAAELKKIDTGSDRVFVALRKEFEEMKTRALHKYTDIVKSVNATGNALANAKNAHACFEAYNLEDVSYVGRVFDLKDARDVNHSGLGSERMYEYISGGKGEQNLICCVASLGANTHLTYSGWCGNSSNLFGCLGLRNKQHCILNKQYTKEEYEELVPKIIEDMNTAPFKDQKGRIYGYGEFFPIELSPFPHNESLAHEHFPYGKEETTKKGYWWYEGEAKHPAITVESETLPDHVRGVDDEILSKIIGCSHGGNCLHQCTRAFRVVRDELAMYRRTKLPLPRLCPNCRHHERLALRNPWKLWKRTCRCVGTASEKKIWKNTAKHFHGDDHCPNEFETSYAPEREEIIYCESCYNSEIA